MDNVLIVSNSEKNIFFFNEILSQNSFKNIITASNCNEAKRILIDREFDLCIIDAPLVDEFGTSFALNIASKGISQVIITVGTELLDEITSKVEDFGVYTLGKPLNKDMFWSMLRLANAVFNKMSMLKNENSKLLKKIEDIKLIDRSKCMIIQHLKMTETQAHKYIEKQAMDMRITRREVAEGILKTYDR